MTQPPCIFRFVFFQAACLKIDGLAKIVNATAAAATKLGAKHTKGATIPVGGNAASIPVGLQTGALLAWRASAALRAACTQLELPGGCSANVSLPKEAMDAASAILKGDLVSILSIMLSG